MPAIALPAGRVFQQLERQERQVRRWQTDWCYQERKKELRRVLHTHMGWERFHETEGPVRSRNGQYEDHPLHAEKTRRKKRLGAMRTEKSSHPRALEGRIAKENDPCKQEQWEAEWERLEDRRLRRLTRLRDRGVLSRIGPMDKKSGKHRRGEYNQQFSHMVPEVNNVRSETVALINRMSSALQRISEQLDAAPGYHVAIPSLKGTIARLSDALETAEKRIQDPGMRALVETLESLRLLCYQFSWTFQDSRFADIFTQHHRILLRKADEESGLNYWKVRDQAGSAHQVLIFLRNALGWKGEGRYCAELLKRVGAEQEHMHVRTTNGITLQNEAPPIRPSPAIRMYPPERAKCPPDIHAI